MYPSPLLFLAAFAVFVGNSAGATTPQDPLLGSLIVGGQNADISDYPFQVSVRLYNEHYCGGSIIGERVVLTAAHCIDDSLSQYYSVQYGLSSLSSTGNVINAAKVIANDKYSDYSHDYDSGLVILASAIPLGPTAQIIPLATVRPAAGTNAVVTGWGTTDQVNTESSVLQSVTVQIISNEQCSEQYSGVLTITDRMLCAGTPTGGKDACEGDSGGPLVANGQIVGIVSFAAGCGLPDFYGVYSNVASLRDWISANSP